MKATGERSNLHKTQHIPPDRGMLNGAQNQSIRSSIDSQGQKHKDTSFHLKHIYVDGHLSIYWAGFIRHVECTIEAKQQEQRWVFCFAFRSISRNTHSDHGL